MNFKLNDDNRRRRNLIWLAIVTAYLLTILPPNTSISTTGKSLSLSIIFIFLLIIHIGIGSLFFPNTKFLLWALLVLLYLFPIHINPFSQKMRLLIQNPAIGMSREAMNRERQWMDGRQSIYHSYFINKQIN